MDDLSLEYLVERQKRSSDTLIRAGVSGAAVLFILLAFFVNMIFLLPAIGCIVAGIIFLPRLDVEYEYLFVAGELSIDCIYAKKSRKNIVNYPLNDVELLAPEGDGRSHADNNGSCRKLDLSSGREDAKKYVLVCSYRGSTDQAF